MVKLFPDQQEFFCHADPRAFMPVKGAWGRGGSTNVLLSGAKQKLVREALAAAFENAQTAPVRNSQAKKL